MSVETKSKPNTDLEALAGEAFAVDTQLAPQAIPVGEVAGSAPEVTQNEVAELAGLLGMVSALFVPLLPSLAAIYTPETCGALAGAALPVMKKYGWSLPDALSKWGPELALCAVAIPLGFSTWKAASADIAAANAKAAASPGREPDSVAVIAAPAPAAPVPGEALPIVQARG